MLTISELSMQIKAYISGAASLDDFEDWFRDASRGLYRSGSPESSAVVAVEHAFARHSLRCLNECSMKEELAIAILPYVLGPVYAAPRKFLVGKPPAKALSASLSARPLQFLVTGR
jgi:hypothetical protein